MHEHPAWLLDIVRPGERFDDVEAVMRRVIQLGVASVTTTTGGPFAAIIIDRDGMVVAGGSNEVLPTYDPTAHAEIVAIRRAAFGRRNYLLRGLRLVSSCAPCLMCAGAVGQAGIPEVVAAARTADAQARGFAEGPPGYDAAAVLHARAVRYHADVCRTESLEIFDRYHGPIYNG